MKCRSRLDANAQSLFAVEAVLLCLARGKRNRVLRPKTDKINQNNQPNCIPNVAKKAKGQVSESYNFATAISLPCIAV